MSKANSAHPDMADGVSKEGSEVKMPTMATSSGSQPGREIAPKLNTDTPVVPGNFHEFNGSQAKQYGDTYSSRMDRIAAALGNKVPVKG